GLLKRIDRGPSSTPSRPIAQRLVSGLGFGHSGTDRDERALPNFEIMTIPDRIKWLARTQNVSGSWGSGAIEVEMTAAALLAFVRAGHTTRAGIYRRQVGKAAAWLQTAQATGFAAFARFRALTELTAAEGPDQALPGGIAVGAATTDSERVALGDSS